MKVYKRHEFYFGLARLLLRLPFRIRYGYRPIKYKLKKGTSYLILSNHTAQSDPVMLSMSFNRPIYFIAQDGLLKQKWGKVLYHMFAPIGKAKGDADALAIREAVSVVSQNGIVGLFASGNCTFNGVESPIDKSIVKFIRLLKSDLILFNNIGMFGVAPRFSAKIRKGKTFGKVVAEIPFNKIQDMSDDELYKIVCKYLIVDHVKAIGDLKYKSDCRAEYLERGLYICPDCGSFSTLESHGNTIKCTKCGYEEEYGEDLKFTLLKGKRKMHTIKEWADDQHEFLRKYPLPDGAIFTDKIRTVEWHEKSSEGDITHNDYDDGKITLYKDEFVVEKGEKRWVMPTKRLRFAFQGRWNLVTYFENKQYYIYGYTPFNGVKYVEMLKKIKNEPIID